MRRLRSLKALVVTTPSLVVATTMMTKVITAALTPLHPTLTLTLKLLAREKRLSQPTQTQHPKMIPAPLPSRKKMPSPTRPPKWA